MYQIMMNKDKSLITTERIKIHQREKLIDKVQFIFPIDYNGYDLRTFVPILIYANSVNEISMETLVISQEEYKDNYFTCVLPIDTKLTKYAGDIVFHVQFTKYDADSRNQLVLTSDEDKMNILLVQDAFQFMADEVLDPITQKIGELDAKAKELDAISQIYAENQVDDIEIDKETDKLYVTAGGVRKGEGVEILTKINDGDIDGVPDGIIDIDENSNFIDVG